ncbi:ribosome hibernation-promoting factor, HPF/YfiA family [Candidatus Nucleicultrix amoebiphila]|jgi:ribosomal subunit interface protein|uniref:Ribosome hibernation promoting factor n=1 Tax=Candidatus Nucleicultrix amoebiphila FS5 TaxID=1414854 RepID=A0A1W6N423_9PROT|nr:ribosome-associated translation inhibitor RaiA [Candidatus Nucleicultrix amoebiphila]ARN84594.1 hypothetical protein GQ61_03880 [Candidatus Nucleicultrix amoebiphila FS5]
MKLTVTGRQVDIGESFQNYIDSEFKALMERYNIHPVETTVVVSTAGHLYRCDIASKIGRVYIRAQETGDEVIQSFDNTFRTLVQRLRRHKRKLMDHYKHHDVHISPEMVPQYVLNSLPPSEHDQDEELAPAIIAELQTEVESISVEEAVMRLDLSNESTYVFRSSKHGGINVVYRRSDGNIGWIDPQKA